MSVSRVRLGRVEAGNRLHFEEVLEAVLAPLAAVAGLLVAAERRGAVVGYALQVDVAGADLTADALGVLDGRARHVAGKPIGRVVGDVHGLGFVLGADDGEHRSEDLFTGDRHVGGDVGEDGWTDVEALVDAFGQARAAGNERCALVDALLDQALDLVPLAAVDDRTNGSAFSAKSPALVLSATAFAIAATSFIFDS